MNRHPTASAPRVPRPRLPRRRRGGAFLAFHSAGSVPRRRPAVSSRNSHVPPKAKRVIFMVMAGGASHLELCDHKPELAKRHGQPMPESITKGQPIAQLQGAKLTCFGPQWEFKKHGKAGIEMNELFAHLPDVADDLCIVRSLQDRGDQSRPGPHLHEHRSSVSGRPSMGSWITYGLGSEARRPAGFRGAHLEAAAGRCSRSRRGSGRPGSCRGSSRASICAARATRCSTSPARRASAAISRRT